MGNFGWDMINYNYNYIYIYIYIYMINLEGEKLITKDSNGT